MSDRLTQKVQRCTDEAWPEAVSDGLSLRCSDCGEFPRFDYHVTDEFWQQHVPTTPARLSVVCLPCLDRRCGGEGLVEALVEVQWTGTGHTVVLTPSRRYTYSPRPRTRPEPRCGSCGGPIPSHPLGPWCTRCGSGEPK